MKNYGKRLRLSEDEVEMIYENRAESTTNTNGNTALDINLAERGIKKKDVVSVKHWQSASGEFRFSIVTKEDLTANENDILKTVSNFIEKHSPHYPSVKRDNKYHDHLLVINPADIHIGKYANHLETGDGYNEHFEIALALYVKCVEILREIAPVDVIHSMSNHDYQSGFHLAHALKSWFRNDVEVTFDISVAHRKYYKYGKNLIGLEHGDGAKMDNLPLLMAQEQPLLWSETTHRYWYLHHLHHKVKHKWRDAKDFIGVTVEYMRSPSGTDSWHSRKGFTGVPKAVEGFIHEKSSGQVARLVHYF